jgi:hypothetical protein
MYRSINELKEIKKNIKISSKKHASTWFIHFICHSHIDIHEST